MKNKHNLMDDPWGWEHENDRPASTKETISIILITVAGIILLASFLLFAAYGIMHLVMCK